MPTIPDMLTDSNNVPKLIPDQPKNDLKNDLNNDFGDQAIFVSKTHAIVQTILLAINTLMIGTASIVYVISHF